MPRNLTTFALINSATGASRLLSVGNVPENEFISGFASSVALAPDGEVVLRYFGVPAGRGDDCLTHYNGCDVISMFAVSAQQ